MTATLTLDRSGLSLEDLVIPGTAPTGAGLFLRSGGLSEPTFDVRTTYAPDSAYVSGSVLLAAVLTASTLPVSVVAQAATSEALAALRAELSAAVFQFAYTVTLTVDGVATAWDAGPCWPAWGELTSPMVDARLSVASLVIPVQPTGA